MQRLILNLAITAWALSAGAALAASGTALGVNPAAEAQRQGRSQTLVVGADIFIGDRVITGAQGQVQIKFSDLTELVVGPSSALLIEDYLLRDDGSAGRMAVNALAGSFRFVTGSAPKDRYRITTPTGTIGVRGTEFDFNVRPVATTVLLYHGALEIRSNGGSRVLLQKQCDLGQFDPAQAVLLGHADNITGQERNLLKAMFPYADKQRPLLREFRVRNAERCLKRPAGGGGPESLVNVVPQDGVPTTPPPQRCPPNSTSCP